MDTQDVLKSLSNLEQNLQNIESARKQVQNVVDAYNKANTELSDLTTNMQSVTQELQAICNTIRRNQTTLSAELQEEVAKAFSSIGDKVENLKTSTEGIQEDFKQVCEGITRQVKTDVGSSLTNLNDGVVSSMKKFNKQADEEMKKIAQIVDAFKAAANTMSSEFRNNITTANTNHKNVQESIATHFQEDITHHVSAFETITGEMGHVLQEYKNLYDNLLKKVNDGLGNVLKSIDDAHTKEQTLLQSIEGSCEKIIAKVNENSTKLTESDEGHKKAFKNAKERHEQAVKENATNFKEVFVRQESNKKLLIGALIIAVISLVLNILIYIK